MIPSQLVYFSSLDDTELEARLKRLVAVERRALVLLLAHLAEFDRRKLYANKGHPSLFAYCTKELGHSEQSAYKRIQAARAVRSQPSLLGLLSRAETNLTAIVILAPHLRTADVTRLFESVRGLPAREVERIAAGLSPRPDSPELVRALPPPSSVTPALAFPSARAPAAATENDTWPVTAPQPSEPTELSEPISGRRYLFRFCADEEFRTRLEKAGDLLNLRTSPSMLELVLGRALDGLLKSIDPACRSERRRERQASVARRSRGRRRSITIALRDTIWTRDGGRCTFIGPTGQRCAATTWLEIDHVRPYCLGGSSEDASNLRLLCRAHNQLEARRKLRKRSPRA